MKFESREAQQKFCKSMKSKFEQLNERSHRLTDEIHREEDELSKMHLRAEVDKINKQIVEIIDTMEQASCIASIDPRIKTEI